MECLVERFSDVQTVCDRYADISRFFLNAILTRMLVQPEVALRRIGKLPNLPRRNLLFAVVSRIFQSGPRQSAAEPAPCIRARRRKKRGGIKYKKGEPLNRLKSLNPKRHDWTVNRHFQVVGRPNSLAL